MQKARDSGAIVATGQVKLVREKEHGPSFKAFLPIYINGVAHNTLKERHQNLTGFVAVLVNIETFIESALNDMGSVGIDMYLYDESAEPDKQFLYFYSSHRRQTNGVSIGAPEENKELQWIGRFNMAGRKWKIICVPAPDFFARYKKSQSWPVLIIGLFLTFALMRYLFNIKGYTAKIESLVTERTDALEKVNKSLKESESKIRAILDQTFQFIGLMTVDGTLIDANRAAVGLVGADEAAYLNKPFWETPWWAHSPQLQEKMREAVKKVAAGESVRFEATHEAKDGNLHYIDFSLKPIKDATGKVIYMIPEGHDITERKAMEERLATTAREWESTFNSITELVSIQDKDSRLVKVNKAYADLFKMKPEALIGRACHSVVHGANEPYLDCPHQNTMKTKKAERLEYFDKRFNAYFEVSTSPIFDANKEVIGTVHIVKDITERKKIEEKLKEAAELKSHFTSMVSHELRTPLAAIKESISIVTDGTAGPLNNDQKEFLDISKRNVDRLARLINDVLDYQKLESGKIEFNIKENSINEIIEEVASIMIPVAKEKALGIVLNLDKDLPKIKCDSDKIVQVFTNLISNAIKFTDKGSVTISSEKQDNAIEIRIKDTGIGIRKEDLPRLFRAFEQLEKGGDRKTGSTGLGLVISKDIIEKHKGKIWVESEFGKGSQFHILLPVEERRV
jgi:PAS domain S-box-containing protein